MNYRHAFHAGNFADVFKHTIVTLLVNYLTRKDKPFVLIDTHGGIGLYDLRSEQAERTGEYRHGVARVLDAPAAPACLEGYLRLVKAANPAGGLRYYPGSPWILRALLRPGDRLDVAELHPEDVLTLKAVLAGDRRVRVYDIDGYTMLKAFLPPKERRGLVLVDPPFEVRDEFERMQDGLAHACRRWATGVYALWYPVKDRAAVGAFHSALEHDDRLPPILAAEFGIGRSAEAGLQRCGMVVVNPPWLLEEQLRECLPFLAGVLAPEADWGLRWLRPETQQGRG